ncbi:MAG TPA: helix-turn-helix transcriptional regulator [Rubrivivax sp.]
MDRAAVPATFGEHLRHWRLQRRFTQMALALTAEVSPRHLSWLESGKAQPSRAMVLRLAEQLEIPLRERNPLLLAAGFAPMYSERRFDDPQLQPARAALQRLLDAHEPYPALAVDRHWDLVAANRMVPLMLQRAAPELLQPPVNVLRVALHPRGLAPMIANLPRWRVHMLSRLQRQIAATGDVALQRLLEELRSYPVTGEPDDDFDGAPVAMPLVLQTPAGVWSLISTLSVFGAPNDIVLSELAIESFFPADEATAEHLRAVAASL